MPDKSLQILCFGDSLTSGFHDFGQSFHPYAIAFTAKLQAALPHMTIDVHHNGKNGDVGAWTPFNERLKQECSKRNYDWVIILAGSNDLAYRVPPTNMYEAFRLNWAVPLSKGSKVLALTVPDAKPRPAWVVEDRDAVNELIRNHKERNLGNNSNSTNPSSPNSRAYFQHPSYTFDLYSKIPYHLLSEQDKERYWDDGLHLTAQGYDWMGEHIADGFLAALALAQQEQPAAAANPGSSRRGLPLGNENDVLEEEGGNPSKLSEGYVVVRKKDLY
ncbi:hypothetical protein E4U55_001592 [Claviceps digitariae]|nr:hypothetical protein E4U55_001592 [Claviceps digitariae]